jgi:DNA-binding response OmpR family regulator
MMNIAIIEDSKMISHIIESGLNMYGYNCFKFSSNKVSTTGIDQSRYKVLILNSDLESVDSIEFVKKLREVNGPIRIIGLSHKSKWKNRVEILNAGADDVITYPFPIQELLAKIQALLRRPDNLTQTKIKTPNYELNQGKTLIYRKSKRIDLRKKEYSLFEYLIRNKERAVSRAELLDHVWDYRRFTDSNTVDVHISTLRKKIGNPNSIKTVHGFGYQFNDSDDTKYVKKNPSEEVELEIPEL